MPRRSAAIGPRTTTLSAALGVAVVVERSGAQIGPDRVEQLGRGRLDGELEVRAPLGVVDRSRRYERVTDLDGAERAGGDHPVKAHEALRRIPRQLFRLRVLRDRPGADDHLGRRDLVEAADDPVVGRPGQPERATSERGR